VNQEHRFADAPAMADALCAAVLARLTAALAARGRASLIVSGGKTPLALFERLAAMRIDWSSVHIALADERWVPLDDPASNDRFVREHLLQGPASAAHFVSMKNAAPSAALGAGAAWSAYVSLARPLDCVLLGMGDDGHTASLFPANSNLAAALDASSSPGCVAMRAPVEPHERLSLNLAALIDAREVLLSSTGEAKWQVYQSALRHGSVLNLPIRAVLRQQKAPVGVYWSP
jgi:6-phosphogluconolactonase